MDDPGRPVWFVGDFDDPWVTAIVASLPVTTVRVHCAGELTDGLFDAMPVNCTLILHRGVLCRHDAECLARWRSRGPRALRVIVCLGPHVRHADIVRWGDLVDAMLPEATARESLARLLRPSVGPQRGVSGSTHRSLVAVVSTNLALRETLVEACAVLGYATSPARDFADAPRACPALWDVPVLEPDWTRELARRALEAPVLVFLGFADRALVREARSAGAAACLELPYDLGDVAAALDRLTSRRGDPPHDVPGPPASRRRQASRTVAGDGREA